MRSEKRKKLIAKARRLQQSGSPDRAEPLVEEVLASAPDNFEALALQGCLLLISGRTQGAREIVERGLQEVPDSSAFAADQGLGLFLLGHLEEARAKLEYSVSFPDADVAAYTRLGAVLLTLGDLEGSEHAFSEAVLRDPERTEVHSNLGSIKLRLGRLEESVSHFEKALKLAPENEGARFKRDALLLEMGRVDEMTLELEDRIEKASDIAERVALRRRLGRVLDGAGRFPEAMSQFRRAMQDDPENAELLLEVAVLYYLRTSYVPALVASNRVLSFDPGNFAAMLLSSRILAELGRVEKSHERLEQAEAEQPGSLPVRLARAFVENESGRPDAAAEELEDILKEFPGCVEAWLQLGHIRMQRGDVEDAVEAFEAAAGIQPSALAGLVEARRFPENEAALRTMERLAANPLIGRESRAAMGFALGRVYEQRREYDTAFERLKAANDLVRRHIPYDRNRAAAYARAVREVFTPELFERFKGAGSSSDRPIFIVGMPRSGTTMTEQIVCSHSEVYGGGELGAMPNVTRLMPKVLDRPKSLYPGCVRMLPPWLLDHAARYYLKKIAALDDSARHVTDKLPHNFMHLGLIASVFPNAAIIHVKRDLRDIAVSNYFVNFKHKYGGMGFAFDLEDLGHALADYREMMRHWREVLPVSFYEIEYEALASDVESESRKLFDFIGLDWDEQVVRFHETKRQVKTASVWQVRRPAYTTSVARWGNYSQWLTVLNEVLEKRGITTLWRD